MHALTRKRSLLSLVALGLAVTLVAAACGNDDDTSADTADTATAEATEEAAPEATEEASDDAEDGAGGAAFSIARVEFGPDGFVELVNHGTAEGDTSGLVICQFPTYNDVPAATVAPGDTVRISADLLGGLDAGTGEVALYNGQNFTDSSTILAYVEWGDPGHERAAVAEAAGIWSGDPVAGGAVAISNAGDAPVDASGWSAE